VRKNSLIQAPLSKKREGRGEKDKNFMFGCVERGRKKRNLKRRGGKPSSFTVSKGGGKGEKRETENVCFSLLETGE